MNDENDQALSLVNILTIGMSRTFPQVFPFLIISAQGRYLNNYKKH